MMARLVRIAPEMLNSMEIMEILNPIGEVVESSTISFVAQCLELPRQNEPRLYDPPAFGSFVKIGPPARTPVTSTPPAPQLVLDDEPDPFADTPAAAPVDTSALPAAVYALVVGASTASMEPNRRPSALGYEDEDELRRHQPQIFELLRTDFTGLLIAYSAGDGQRLRRHLPPVPPRIHSRVRPCSDDEVRALTVDLNFLRAVLAPGGGSIPGVPGDELAAACLREAKRVQNTDEFMIRAGRTLAGILADDYERLQAILRNVI
jgi:hypothetical protein